MISIEIKRFASHPNVKLINSLRMPPMFYKNFIARNCFSSENFINIKMTIPIKIEEEIFEGLFALCIDLCLPYTCLINGLRQEKVPYLI